MQEQIAGLASPRCSTVVETGQEPQYLPTYVITPPVAGDIISALNPFTQQYFNTVANASVVAVYPNPGACQATLPGDICGSIARKAGQLSGGLQASCAMPV